MTSLRLKSLANIITSIPFCHPKSFNASKFTHYCTTVLQVKVGIGTVELYELVSKAFPAEIISISNKHMQSKKKFSVVVFVLLHEIKFSHHTNRIRYLSYSSNSPAIQNTETACLYTAPLHRFQPKGYEDKIWHL